MKVNRKYYKLTPLDQKIKVQGARGQALDQKVEKYQRTELANHAELKSGDLVEVETTVAEWNARAFVHTHTMRRGDEVLCEGREVRAFVIRDPNRGGRLRAVPVPDDWRAACGAPAAAETPPDKPQ